MQETVGLDGLEGFGERQAAIETEPGSGVPMPLDIEAVAADPVEAGEGAVELFAEVLREAGAVALDEAVAVAVPFAEDVDGIVELGGADGRQEPRLQDLVDEALAGGRDDDLLGIRQAGGPPFRRHAAASLRSIVVRRFHGSSSLSRDAG